MYDKVYSVVNGGPAAAGALAAFDVKLDETGFLKEARMTAYGNRVVIFNGKITLQEVQSMLASNLIEAFTGNDILAQIDPGASVEVPVPGDLTGITCYWPTAVAGGGGGTPDNAGVTIRIKDIGQVTRH